MKQDPSEFDIVVVGGGHAGVEAALAADRLGSRVLLITHRFDRLGEMSCNPAIGGLGKGHLVREIDALDGAMGVAADRAGIQFRLLNRRKGPAVRGPRAQCDRAFYRNAIQSIVSASSVVVTEDEVTDLILHGSVCRGVTTSGGMEYRASAVVITTGTFLRGLIHIGEQKTVSGRMGDPASTRLATRFDDMGVPLGRLKTGTPPRLVKASIDWDSLEQQHGDVVPTMFSSLSDGPIAPQVTCAITYTNDKTHEIIRKNIGLSAMYSGQIDGRGPRYCPSIEDKISRFPNKSAHQVFLEPEGVDNPLVYPNGVSTSLPREVQREYIRSMVGLENAEIAQPGYAIEYDFVNPECLGSDLQLRDFPGLYLAGQINGTTGYEEAAAQGLVAGINAGLQSAGREPITFSRADCYIGVMIDDLISRGVTEPYRMFTSRAEFRLSLRIDNADERLTPLGEKIGCVSEERASKFARKMSSIEEARARLKEISITPDEALALGFEIKKDGVRRTAYDLLSFASVDPSSLQVAWPNLRDLSAEVLEQLNIEATYRYYVERQSKDAALIQRDESLEFPVDIDWRSLSGLSGELSEKLALRKPQTLRDASKVEGVTPAALIYLRALIIRRERAAS